MDTTKVFIKKGGCYISNKNEICSDIISGVKLICQTNLRRNFIKLRKQLKEECKNEESVFMVIDNSDDCYVYFGRL